MKTANNWLRMITHGLIGFLLAFICIAVAAYIYLRYGHPPVATADKPFPDEETIVHILSMSGLIETVGRCHSLRQRAILSQEPRSTSRSVPSATALRTGDSSFGKWEYPMAPQLWTKHSNGVVGVSDDPPNVSYWKVDNGIRLTGMPSFKHILTTDRMWQVSFFIAKADQPLSSATLLALFIPFMLHNAASAQADSATFPLPAPTPPRLEVDQVSDILGLTERVRKLQMLQAQDGCGFVVASLEELTLRQDLLESVQMASLDIDGVMGMIANERGKLSDLQTSLKASRDKTVAKLNAAALITGSGVGAAVSATQFTTVGSRTNNLGDGIGIGSGAASTLLAYLAVRKQHGPEGMVRDVSNMLAPLFDRPSVLNTNYPFVTLQFLGSVPPGETAERGTRLEQLKAEWGRSGRLDSSDTYKEQKKITVLTGSAEQGVKISLDELTDRIAMLGDVSGRIALMKRDLALLMLSYRARQGAEQS